MARATLADVIEKWNRSYGEGYGLNEYAVKALLNDLDRNGFAVVRKVTEDDLVADDG